MRRVGDRPSFIAEALEDYTPPPAKCLFGRPHSYGSTYIPGVFACTSCDAVLDNGERKDVVQ